MLELSEFPWPVVFRRSHRCKYLRINLTRGKAVEIVYPHYSTKKQAMLFLQSKRDWVDRHYQSEFDLSESGNVLIPKKIYFPVLEQEWSVHVTVASKRVHFTIQQDDVSGALMVSGPSDRLDDALPTLRKWLKQQAVLELEPLLYALSRQYQLPFDSVSWRFQKTRWGSCSDGKRLSLNVKLLFLSFKQVRYVMLHELCHTRVMNHSHAFWNLLSSCCSAAREIDPGLHEVSFLNEKWITEL